LIDLVDHPERYQVCQTHAGVRYCAFRGYAGWIDRWAASITPVLGAVPPSARPKNLVVRQDLGLLFGSDLPERTIPESVALDPFTELPLEPLRSPGIYPGVTWGRGSAGGRYELGMALLAATWAVGLPRTPYDIT